MSTQIGSCDGLYPLYYENLFTQEVIVAISQTLGDLGDEFVNVMSTMASKNLYRDRHDDYVANLGEACEFKALNDRTRVSWKALFSPFMFSVALAVTAFIIGCVKFTYLRKSWQSESISSQCSVEPEDELASLLDNDVELKKKFKRDDTIKRRERSTHYGTNH